MPRCRRRTQTAAQSVAISISILFFTHRIRQLSINQQERHFRERAPLRKLLDGVSSVPEDPLATLDLADPAGGRGSVHVTGVVEFQTEITELGGEDGVVVDG